MRTAIWQRIAIFVTLLVTSLMVLAGAGSAAAQGGNRQTGGDLIDFNGDGFGDLAIGVPFEDTPAGIEDAGAVNVLYGKGRGLVAVGDQFWTADTAGGSSQEGALFGTALAAADFNGDSYTDLAVGAPGGMFGNHSADGQVHVIYGSAAGLMQAGAQVFSQDSPGMEGVAEAGDAFGHALVAGNFNGDAFADLAIGVPFEDYESGGVTDMGAVNVIYGTWAGLSTASDLIIHPALGSVSGTPAEDGRFGYVLESGDFDNDGFEDLATGIPGYIVSGDDVGAVEVFYGSAAGVSLLGEQLWRQGFGGLPGSPEPGDAFGARLAAGDFDNNGAKDLAIGVPGEDDESGQDTIYNSGAVHILYGYAIADGLSSSGNQLWHRGLPAINGSPGYEVFFGGALAAADFDGDGADDLAVGAHGDDPVHSEQGSVQVFYSNGAILSTAGQQLWYQGRVAGVAEASDRMGWALGAGDFNGDGYADLAAGAPYEDIGNRRVLAEDAGAVNVLNGSATGLTRARNRIWHQQSAGILDVAETGDMFGRALTR